MHNLQDSTISKVLSGNAKPEEIQKVIAWFSTKEGQEYLSTHMDKEYEMKGLPSILSPSPSLLRKILWNIQMSVIKNSPRLWLKVAAAFITVFILTGGGIVANHYFDLFGTANIITVHVSRGNRQIITLPDGSHVYMGPGSGLSYPDRFSLFHRNIQFTGDAYFQVKHQKYRSFNIKSNEMNIEVLGTSFNLMADTLSSEIDLHLDRGLVRMHTTEGKEYYVHPGEHIVYDKIHKQFKRTDLDESLIYINWKTGTLQFHDAPLETVLNVLSARYNVNFKIENQRAKHFRYTITWDNASIEDMMQDLALITPVRFIKETPDRITVK